jgi:hypothetical protein
VAALAVLDLGGLLLHHHDLLHHQAASIYLLTGHTGWRKFRRQCISLGLRVRNLGDGWRHPGRRKRRHGGT